VEIDCVAEKVNDPLTESDGNESESDFETVIGRDCVLGAVVVKLSENDGVTDGDALNEYVWDGVIVAVPDNVLETLKVVVLEGVVVGGGVTVWVTVMEVDRLIVWDHVEERLELAERENVEVGVGVGGGVIVAVVVEDKEKLGEAELSEVADFDALNSAVGECVNRD
jgi:hypothetical protein